MSQQLCTINTAICSLNKKNKRGVHSRPGLRTNPAKVEAHTAALLGTQCCLQDCSVPAQSTSTSSTLEGTAVQGTGSTGHEWEGDRSRLKCWQITRCKTQTAHHQCTKTQEFGAAHTLVLALGFPQQYLQDGSLLEITSLFFPKTGRRDYFYTATDHFDKNK